MYEPNLEEHVEIEILSAGEGAARRFSSRVLNVGQAPLSVGSGFKTIAEAWRAIARHFEETAESLEDDAPGMGDVDDAMHNADAARRGDLGPDDLEDWRIEAMKDEAIEAGDTDQVSLCVRALAGDIDARAECAGVINAAIAEHRANR